eukprot:595602-Prymnesium_polylepis.1
MSTRNGRQTSRTDITRPLEPRPDHVPISNHVPMGWQYRVPMLNGAISKEYGRVQIVHRWPVRWSTCSLSGRQPAGA